MAPHFSKFENSLAEQLVIKYSSVIGSKKTDGKSLQEKKKSWVELAKEFNAQAEVTQRTAQQLQKWWDNQRTRAKTAVAQERKERRKTGGGPPPLAVSQNIALVASIVPDQLHSLDNPFDDDSMFHEIEVQEFVPMANDEANAHGMDQIQASESGETNEDSETRHAAALVPFIPPAHPGTSAQVRATAVNSDPSPRAVRNQTANRTATPGRLNTAQKNVVSLAERQHKRTMKLLRDRMTREEEKHQLEMEVLQMKKAYWTKKCEI